MGCSMHNSADNTVQAIALASCCQVRAGYFAARGYLEHVFWCGLELWGKEVVYGHPCAQDKAGHCVSS